MINLVGTHLVVAGWSTATKGDLVVGWRGQWSIFSPGAEAGGWKIIDGGSTNPEAPFAREADASAAAHAIAVGRARSLQNDVNLPVDVWHWPEIDGHEG